MDHLVADMQANVRGHIAWSFCCAAVVDVAVLAAVTSVAVGLADLVIPYPCNGIYIKHTESLF